MSSFHSTLARFHRGWCLGRVVFLLLTLAAVYVAGMLLHGWLDYQFALSPESRARINLALRAVLEVAGLVWLVQTLRTPREKTAALADAKLADPRQRVATAAHLEKTRSAPAVTEMQRFHLDRALNEASGELGKLPLASRLPVRALACCSLALLALGALVWGISHWAPEPFRVVAARITNPAADIPPYSPLRFHITPDEPRAVYGGHAVVQVKIYGGEVTDDVFCLVRNPATGEVEKTTVYREGKTGFARKFENALAPVEFAFASGRARSAWHRLDVLLQPKVSAATVTVAPPAYTGMPEQSYPLDSGEIKAPVGSTVTLALQSNRPLTGGELRIKALDREKRKRAEVVEADRTGDHTVSFTWVAHRSTQVSAVIRDVRSTPSAKPLELVVKAEPDQTPTVDLTSPEQMVLATPDTELPFLGEVEDDYGLAKVSLVRALVGYRDRSRVLADSLVKREFDFKEPLKLSELGVEVGQVLEFYLEAMDRNPSLLGMGVSDVVRVKIISVEDYAERIRAKVRLERFTARYRVLAEAIRQSREALKELDQAADVGDKKAFESARKKAAAAHAKAEQLAARIGKDFNAFAMEKRLSEIAKEAAGKLGENRKALAGLTMDAGEAAARRAIAEMQKRLGGVEKKAGEIQRDAGMVKKVARVMEMAAEFKKIHNTQKSIVERMQNIANEVAKGNTRNTGQLDGLARVQDRNREALQNLAKELKKRAAELPDAFATMKQDVDQFLAALEQLDIPDPMNTAAGMARKGKTIDATANALLALSLIEQLMKKPNNGFCQMCNGGGPRFQVKPDLAQTMAEMLDALMKRAGGQGKGSTGGAGGGMGGSGQDGFSVAGNSANIPVYGPDRLAFSESSSGKSAHAGSGGRAGPSAAAQQPGSRVKPKEFREAGHAKILPENIPAKYRGAVKRYFSQDDTISNPSQQRKP